MRVVIEARALAKNGGGTRTYVEQLTKHLLHTAGPDTISLVGTKQQATWLLPWWLNHTLPREITGLQPDVVHFTKAAVPRRKRGPTVVTIYDLIPFLFPQSQRLGGAYYWRKQLERAALLSDHIITISEASKRDIVHHLQVSPEKITVTPLAVDVISQGRSSVSASGKLSAQKPYILYVGTIEPRKNVPALIRSFAQIAANVPHQLVLVGKSFKDNGVVDREITRLGLLDRVERLGFVSPKELTKLYAGANLFVLPSIYEGWGFPAQEAMAHGVPVIVSDGGSLPEVAGEAGIVVPFSSDQVAIRLHDEAFEIRLAQAMGTILLDEDKRQILGAAGKSQATKRTWTDVARETIEVYHRVYKLAS